MLDIMKIDNPVHLKNIWYGKGPIPSRRGSLPRRGQFDWELTRDDGDGKTACKERGLGKGTAWRQFDAGWRLLNVDDDDGDGDGDGADKTTTLPPRTRQDEVGQNGRLCIEYDNCNKTRYKLETYTAF